MDTGKLKNLLKKHMAGNLSGPERLLLWMELDNPENADAIRMAILELSREAENDRQARSYQPEKWEEMIDSILKSEKPKEPAKTYKITSPDDTETPVYTIRPKRKQISWAAAAAILILLAAGSYFFISRKSVQQIANTEKPALINDIAPGSSKAILYLANGQKINLDSAHNGELARLGNTTVTKTDSGKLLYATTENNNSELVSLNTLQTPRGGIFQITLPDGTRAWLNAESSITYPTRFNKPQRDVTITGEVYFEVAKDAAHPFIVSLPAKTKDQGESGHWMRVEVLGTHFNINNYEDEGNGLARTTLLEGSVRVSAHGESKLIRPGEQASASFAGFQIGVTAKVDLEKVMAWKNGQMVLTSSSVKQIMQEISRWYDVDIKYGGAIPEKKFYGSIDRNVPLSSVLNALKAYGVETKLEGKTIIVQ